jgi:hypothetical protein
VSGQPIAARGTASRSMLITILSAHP